MNKNMCCAIVKGDKCGNKAKFVTQAYVRGSDAYKHNALPPRYVGGGWMLCTVRVCGTHKNVLNAGKAMNCKVQIVEAPVQEKVVPEGKFLCGYCHIKHATVAEVKACGGVKRGGGEFFLQNTQVKPLQNRINGRKVWNRENLNPVKKVSGPFRNR